MTTKDAFALKKYDPVLHKRLGQCIVVGMIPEMGPLILPITVEGLWLLTEAGQMPAGTPMLASDFKQNLKKTLEKDAQPTQVSAG